MVLFPVSSLIVQFNVVLFSPLAFLALLGTSTLFDPSAITTPGTQQSS